MHHKRMFLMIPAIALTLGFTAKADNTLTQDQLMKATQHALQDSSTADPTMAKSISGFKTTTVGANAQVIINMDADGMHMTEKYLCVAQDGDLSCHFQ